MLIVCPACVSSYKVEPAALAHATELRCAHCRRPLQSTVPSGLQPPGLRVSSSVDRERSALPGIAALCASLAVISGMLFWREPIAHAVPGAASLYRLAGLPCAAAGPVVTDVKTVLTSEGLTVEGTLVNPPRSRMTLPRLDLTIRDSADDILARWSVAAPKPSLRPGETVTSTSHLDKPPPDGHDLAVSFAADRVAMSAGL